MALRLHGEAVQSGETCVRDSQDTIVHRGLVVEASLVGSQGSALGHTVVMTSVVCNMWFVLADQVPHRYVQVDRLMSNEV